MSQRIIYKNPDGSIAVIIPVPDCGLTLEQIAAKDVPTGLPAMAGAAKVWVNFNGTGTVAIRAAFNVSSITDNGIGDYTINFTTPMPDASYCVLA